MKNEQTAEAVLYAWACGAMTTAQAKATCLKLGYIIDFRQADSNLIDAFNLNTQTWQTLEV
jgi:hypothetical protein